MGFVIVVLMAYRRIVQECKGLRREVGAEQEECYIGMTVTRSACCIVETCESRSGEKGKVLGLGESVTEKENESLPQEYRGGKVVVGLFIGKFCLPVPSPLPVCLSENVCSEHGYFVSRRLKAESGVIGVG